MLAAGGKGIYWTALVILFGLAQLWVATGFLLFKDPSSVTFYEMTKDGILLFFALAVTMTITMDYWFDIGISQRTDLAKATAFVFFPIIVMGFVIAAYAIITLSTSTEKIDIANSLSISALVLSAVFATVAKSYLFIASELKSDKQ